MIDIEIGAATMPQGARLPARASGPGSSGETGYPSAEAVRAVLDAHRWQKALGRTVVASPHARFVVDAAHDAGWAANHVDAITARTDNEIDAVLALADRHYADRRWRVFDTDPLTPPAFVARLAAAGHVVQTPTVLMLADEPVVAGSGVAIAPLSSAADRAAFLALAGEDHAEIGGLAADHAGQLAEASLAAAGADGAAFRYHLASVDGRPVGYAACVAAPGGIGVVEDLFTSSACRRRGIASALVAHLDAQLRQEGCDRTLIGAASNDGAQRLYTRLGFRPLATTHRWVATPAP